MSAPASRAAPRAPSADPAESETLRQAVLMFGGDFATESNIDRFGEVSLVRAGSATLRGALYLLTRRLIFVPRGGAPPAFVHAAYDSLRCISGTRTDLAVGLVDSAGATARFQFASAPALFQAFNLLRLLAEGARGPDAEYRALLAALGRTPARDETPFSAIEVELGEGGDRERAAPAPPAAPAAAGEDPLARAVAPLQRFYERCNALHLDIHVKIRVLFCLSLVSFCLKFMPFLPFCAACMTAFLLFTAWRSMNRDLDEAAERSADAPPVAEGCAAVQRFVGDWLLWGNPRKGIALGQWSLAVIVGWAVLPQRLYAAAGAVGYIALVGAALVRGRPLAKIFSGPWIST
jgi:hypothetical protein